jgi:hypothetical protein
MFEGEPEYAVEALMCMDAAQWALIAFVQAGTPEPWQ